MKIYNITKHSTICNSAVLANSLIKRLKGLLFIKDCKAFKDFDGLVISPCKAIHSFFMDFEFDAIFLDKKKKVLKIISEFTKNKISPFVLNARYVIELPKGKIKDLNIEIEDVINFEL